MVYYDLPAFLKLTDKSGKLIEIYQLPSKDSTRFGNEKVKTQTTDGSTTTVSWDKLRFSNETQLQNSYSAIGGNRVKMKAVLNHLRRVIPMINRSYYFEQTGDRGQIYTGKGKFDYDKLDEAQAMAIEAIESGNAESLSKSIAIWEENLKEYDSSNKKARINAKVATGLHENLVIAYTKIRNFDKARENVKQGIIVRKVADSQTNFTSTVTSGRFSFESYSNAIDRAEAGFKSNGSLDLPSELNDALDFTKELGTRKRMKDYNLIELGDKTNQFSEEYFKIHPVKEVVNNGSTEDADGGFMDRLQPDVGGGQILMLNSFFDAAIVGNFPMEIIEIENLTTLQANSMGFSVIPSEIGNMTKLTKLGLKSNGIATLPESIGKLTNLKVLNLSSNQLKTLPESIKNCTQLKKVTLKGNQISASEMKKIQSWLPAKCKIK